MSRALEGQASFWIETTPDTDYPRLQGEVSVDVAVVGGGITGLTAATLLKAAGKTVAVLESRRVARGASGFTTAKVTAGHGLVYSHLERSFGAEDARRYAESQQAAVEQVARLVEERGIDCDFERKANYVYAEKEEEVQQIRDEVEAAGRAGLPVVFVAETNLPYPVAGALRLENQAQFHPRKYLLALAEAIPGDGSHVFEGTTVLDASDGDPCAVRTPHGDVRARDVVLATHLPILDRGLFFARTYPHRSYAVAAPIDEAAAPDGMFINTGVPTRSVRVLRDGERTFVQVGGQGHKTGAERETPERYRALEEFLRRHWPQAGEVQYRWSTQDFMSFDKVPYIGRLRRRSRHLWVGTGYTKWGMSSGTLAGMLLTDAVLGRENGWATLYDAKRVNVRAAAASFVKENSAAGARFLLGRLRRGERGAFEELRNGEGAVVRVGARKRAAYRDDEGRLHVLSAVCRHLGCIVAWNPAERTWDCPCHGSRYAATGEVVHGPTTEDLERVE